MMRISTEMPSRHQEHSLDNASENEIILSLK